MLVMLVMGMADGYFRLRCHYCPCRFGKRTRTPAAVKVMPAQGPVIRRTDALTADSRQQTADSSTYKYQEGIGTSSSPPLYSIYLVPLPSVYIPGIKRTVLSLLVLSVVSVVAVLLSVMSYFVPVCCTCMYVAVVNFRWVVLRLTQHWWRCKISSSFYHAYIM